MVVMIEGASFESLLEEADKLKDSFCDLVDQMYECYESSKESNKEEMNYRNMRGHHSWESKSPSMSMRRSYGRYDF